MSVRENPSTYTPAATLASFALSRDEAALAAAIAQLDTPTRVDALERLTLAHEAVALARSSNAARVQTYRTALLAGVRALAERAKQAAQR